MLKIKATNIMKDYWNKCDEMGTQLSHLCLITFSKNLQHEGRTKPKWAHPCPPRLSAPTPFSIQELYPSFNEHHYERGHDPCFPKTSNAFLPFFILFTLGLSLKASMKWLTRHSGKNNLLTTSWVNYQQQWVKPTCLYNIYGPAGLFKCDLKSI